MKLVLDVATMKILLIVLLSLTSVSCAKIGTSYSPNEISDSQVKADTQVVVNSEGELESVIWKGHSISNNNG